MYINKHPEEKKGWKIFFCTYIKMKKMKWWNCMKKCKGNKFDWFLENVLLNLLMQWKMTETIRELLNEIIVSTWEILEIFFLLYIHKHKMCWEIIFFSRIHIIFLWSTWPHSGSIRYISVSSKYPRIFFSSKKKKKSFFFHRSVEETSNFLIQNLNSK